MSGNNVIGILLGRKYSGKSYLLSQLLPINQKTHFVCDYAKQFHGIIYEDFGQLIQDFKDEKLKGKLCVCRFINKTDFLWLFQLLTKIENAVLVIDEVQLFIKYQKMNDNLYTILTTGRNFNIDILVATISPIGIDKMIFRQADFIVCFNIQEKSDIEYLRSLSITSEVADQLPLLDIKKHERIVLGDTQYLSIPSTYKVATKEIMEVSQ